eukprot:6097124-Prymnesium_polylepis.1
MGARWRSWYIKPDSNASSGNAHGQLQSESKKEWRVSSCIGELFQNGSMSRPCVDATGMSFNKQVATIDCIDGSHSTLGRAGDCNVQVIYETTSARQLVWYRRDFGTSGGWREIRGAQVASVEPRLRNHVKWRVGKPFVTRVENSYYLDRLGKLERFRRQIYSVTFTRRSANLWLGLMTVIEWAKDDSEATGPIEPAFRRDTTSIFLVTSRDGIHVDDEWVYARRPLVPKGALQRDWNSGFVLAASEIVPDRNDTLARVYFEARTLRHEDRFKEPGVIGAATWRHDAI